MFAALKRAWRQYQESLAIDRDDHHDDDHGAAADRPRDPLDDLPAATLNAFAELGAMLVAHLPPSDAEALRMELQAQLEEDLDAQEALAQWFSDRVDPDGPPLGFLVADWKAREEIAWQVDQLARAHGLTLRWDYDVDGDEHWKAWREREESPVDTPLRLAAAALAPLGVALLRFGIDDAVYAFGVRAEEAERAAALCGALGLEVRDGGADAVHGGFDFAKSFRRAWQGLGASGDGMALRDELLARYAEPQRRYHTRQHLAECLALFDEVREATERPDEIEIALWFHDAIYEIRGGDNEARSADWAREALTAAGVAVERAERVRELVLVTKHTGVPATPDERVLVDIDLAILGADEPRFAEYERQIREEYAHVPGFLFRRKRREILRGFLDRPVLFSTPMLRERLEARARENLARAVR